MAETTAAEALEALALRFDKEASEAEELQRSWAPLDRDRTQFFEGVTDAFKDAAAHTRDVIAALPATSVSPE